MEETTEQLQAELEKYRKRYGKFGDIRNLFILKPTLNDIIVFFLIIAVVILSFLYMNDTSVCRETIANLQNTACEICSKLVNG